MKKYSLFIIAVILFQFAQGQDTIFKFNGDQIIGKVNEISATQIKYKKANFPDGPLYVENKSDIKLIKYSNGTKEEFQAQPEKKIADNDISPPKDNSADYYSSPVAPNHKIDGYGSRYRYQNKNIREPELYRLLLQTKDKEIVRLVGSAKDAKALQYIGFGAIPLGIGAIYFLGKSIIYNAYGGTKTNSPYLSLSGLCLIGAVACPISSGIFKHKRTSSNREAIRIYNEKY